MCQPAPSGLVGWWPAEGNADDVVAGKDGVLIGGASFGPGEVGEAFVLNGSGQYIVIPDAPALRPASFTVEAWYSFQTWTGLHQMIGKPYGSGTYDSFAVWILDGKLSASVATAGVQRPYLTYSWSPTLGVWHHVAYSYDPNAVAEVLYVDGAVVASNSVSGQVSYDTHPLVIGDDIENGVSSFFFDGSIDEVSLYNRALSADEIAAIYAARNSGKCGLPPIILGQSESQIVSEGSAASFSVTNAGTPPFTYQWRFDGTNIAGATDTTLFFPDVALTNAGSYSMTATNAYGSITSAPVVLTVTHDITPPIVLSAMSIHLTNVELEYSKPLDPASATNVGNYAFTNGEPILGAALGPDNRTVLLATPPLIIDSNYTLLINGVRDQDVPPNIIATNTLVTFEASLWVSQDIGNPSIPSIVNVTSSNGANIISAGNGIAGVRDQFNIEYQLQIGDFDVSVCLASLNLTSLWAQAGLMAREDLTTISVFAATLATPGLNGDSFVDRTTPGALATKSGNFPVNYPNSWLRLSRAGNVFTGFGSYDGTNWTVLGTASIPMPTQIYLGLAIASDSTNQPTTARFVDDENTPVSAVLAAQANPSEPLGPSSRNTGIVFSEIMYKPAPRSDGNNTEFVEIYNSLPYFQDISSYQVTCADMKYTFPPNTIIPGGAFFVLAASPQGIANVYGLISNVFGPYNGSLKHSETLELMDEQSNVLLTVPFTDVYPWPVAADGTGHSIVLSNPTYGEDDWRAWAISDQAGGSPGQMDPFTPSALRNVVINEILPHTENPSVPQFIELYNHSAASVNIGGCVLTDDPTTNKFVIPADTILGPAGFVSFTQSQFGFTLNGQGETLYFINPDKSRVLDAVQFGAQSDGVSYQAVEHQLIFRFLRCLALFNRDSARRPC